MFKSLVAWRGIFALFIFIAHCDVMPEGRSIFNFGSIAVSFFFILSGFLLSCGYKERILSGNFDYIDFIIKRVSKIYPLHFLIAICFIYLKWGDVFVKAIPFNLTLTQSWIPLPGVFFSLNGGAWFLSTILFFYLMFPFLTRWYYKSKNRTLIIYVIAVAIIIVMGQVLPLYWRAGICYISPLSRILDFMFGILLYDFYILNNRMINNISYTRKTILEALSIISLLFLFLFDPFAEPFYRSQQYNWIPLGILIIVFSLKSSGFFSNIIEKKWFIRLGEISFSIYMLHGVVINVIGDHLKLDWWLVAIIELVLIIILSYYSFFYMEPKASRLMIRIISKIRC